MNDKYLAYNQALQAAPPQLLLLDLNALEQNSKWVQANSGGKTIRLATKSLRSLEVIQHLLTSSPIFQGLMTYTLEESLWLRERGMNDILMGYPSTDTASLRELAKDPSGIVLMVDHLEHLNYLQKIADEENGAFEICVDIDLSMDLPGVRFGVFRSSIQKQNELENFLIHLQSCKRLKLVGAMGYEAQIAGVGDRSWLMRLLKKLSLPQLQKRRKDFIALIRKHGHKLRIVNGGGTGSLKNTTTEEDVTEVTVGSGFYAPTLFDHYNDFKLSPALTYSLPVVRKPNRKMVTVLGGGYIASGELHPNKTPTPYLPKNLKLLKHEGAGEVQTPLYLPEGLNLDVGSRIFFRHAKAGEVCERFNSIYVYQNGTIIKEMKTYRGEGKCFL